MNWRCRRSNSRFAKRRRPPAPRTYILFDAAVTRSIGAHLNSLQPLITRTFARFAHFQIFSRASDSGTGRAYRRIPVDRPSPLPESPRPVVNSRPVSQPTHPYQRRQDSHLRLGLRKSARQSRPRRPAPSAPLGRTQHHPVGFLAALHWRPARGRRRSAKDLPPSGPDLIRRQLRRACRNWEADRAVASGSNVVRGRSDPWPCSPS